MIDGELPSGMSYGRLYSITDDLRTAREITGKQLQPTVSALRPVGAILAVVALFAAAGCVGFVLGEEPLRYGANNATIAEENRGGFELTEERTIAQNVSINESGVNRTVSISNYAGIYTKNESINAEEQQLATLAVVSTPLVDVFERPVNPIGNMTERELIEFLADQTNDSQYSNLDEFERVPAEEIGPRTDNVTVLGKTTDVAVFRGTQEIQGREVELRLYVTRVRHGDDYVLLFGGHSMLHPAEGYAIVDLMRSIEHDAED
jgi:hypothetical protein